MKDLIKNGLNIKIEDEGDGFEVTCEDLYSDSPEEEKMFGEDVLIGRRISLIDIEDSQSLHVDIIFHKSIIGSDVSIQDDFASAKSTKLSFYDNGLYEFCKMVVAAIDAKRECGDVLK